MLFNLGSTGPWRAIKAQGEFILLGMEILIADYFCWYANLSTSCNNIRDRGFDKSRLAHQY